MRFDLVLLDIDGTIVDSNDAHAQAWVKAFAQHGRTVPFERIRPLIGMGGDKLLERLAGLDSERGEGRRIAESRTKIFAREFLPALKPTPGARAMIEWLKREGATITIATSATAGEVEGLLKAAGVSDLIDHVTSSDDADDSKPDPDIVVAALKRSGAAGRAPVMFGDTPYDIEAASRAGLGTVAFRSGGWPDADLSDALAIFDHPEALLAHVNAPPFT
ncbi:MAG: HAD-superfamily hydrolase, subfamily variant 3 [Acidobacteria bacterium]|nr:HAD-superfamily hydrolase, subfamily variant 3 [Acidobacteriota bacterium]